jgi:hypothetical protein
MRREERGGERRVSRAQSRCVGAIERHDDDDDADMESAGRGLKMNDRIYVFYHGRAGKLSRRVLGANGRDMCFPLTFQATRR